MSSFIVSQECMNNIISGLFWTHEFKNSNSILKRNGYDCVKDFQRLGDDLINLNARGTGQRYQDGKMLVTLYRFKWDDKHKTPNKYQVLKSMECLLYQCSEGDTDETELYRFLSELIDCWMSFIIDKIPEYKAAKWD